MKTVCSFVAKFASLISWKLSCFDRVIFKGHLPFSYAAKFVAFVDYQLKMRRADFMQVVAPAWSERLVEHGKAYAQKHARLYEYYQGDIDKDAWAKAQWHQQPVKGGLIGVLCVMESCPTFKLAHGAGRPCFVSKKVPQRVLYYYFWDKDLGLMHVRLQTWAPFTGPVYVNGLDYVARQWTQRGYGLVQQDNAFVQRDHPAQTQQIANRFSKLPWPRLLERYARQVNSRLGDVLKDMTHYWVTDQAE